MNTRNLWWSLLVCALAFVGCDGGGGEGTNDSGSPPGEDGGPPAREDGGGPATDGGDPVTDGGGGGPAGWALRSHPCVGNRTDALWRDDDGTLYVGCGTTTTGDQGLYVSTDDGVTWVRPTTTPAGFFETWRVNDISRSADGHLYIAGIGPMSRRVVRADTSGASWQLEETFNAGSTVGTAFTVGRFRRASDGRAIAESLTGTDVVYRASDSDDWEAVGDWGDSFGGLQIIDLALHDDEFYGAGSTITQPPYAFLPTGEAGFGFRVVNLAGTGIGAYVGEMWGVDVDDGGLIFGGVNQTRNVGMIYVLESAESTSVSVFDVSTLYPDDTTWIRGVCRHGSTLMAVGELSSENLGLVLRSDDAGGRWMDVTPDTGNPAAPLRPMHECVMVSDDLAYVAGANGQIAIWSR